MVHELLVGFKEVLVLINCSFITILLSFVSCFSKELLRLDKVNFLLRAISSVPVSIMHVFL